MFEISTRSTQSRNGKLNNYEQVFSAALENDRLIS